MKRLILCMTLLLGWTQVSAAGLNTHDLYFGGGLNRNTLDDAHNLDPAYGFQFFGGYQLPRHIQGVDSAIEIGYLNSGDFEYSDRVCVLNVCTSSNVDAGDVDGLWASYVAKLPLQQNLGLIGRLGLDFGDDDGLLFGVGMGAFLSNSFELRGEYVVRDHMDSLQANFIIHL